MTTIKSEYSKKVIQRFIGYSIAQNTIAKDEKIKIAYRHNISYSTSAYNCCFPCGIPYVIHSVKR